jgi:hypothetical protein
MNARDLSDPNLERLKLNQINILLIEHAIWTP